MTFMTAVHEREERKQIALEYLEAIRGNVPAGDLYFVEHPATHGREFLAIESAIGLANYYNAEISDELHSRARDLFINADHSLQKFDKLLAGRPSLNPDAPDRRAKVSASLHGVYEREDRKQMALEYVEALRGRVSKSALDLVETSANSGYEFDAIEIAIDIANTYGFELSDELHARARNLIVSEGCSPEGFDEMLADRPSLRPRASAS